MSNEEIAKDITIAVINKLAVPVSNEDFPKYACETYLEIFKAINNTYNAD